MFLKEYYSEYKELADGLFKPSKSIDINNMIKNTNKNTIPGSL